ncbi:MAG: cytochrome c-type biogenesis CcmF C-terminal domain-containing protein, partial [Candidatus Binatia bacterium]|nr:cytochrome c-type biogenesis CcmF C-terminal domain-containing protein [Candidatus Binatia bacterium]
LKGSQQATHYRVEGTFRVFSEGQDTGTLLPALKFFPRQQSPIGRAVLRSGLVEDLYLILSGFSDLEQNQATLKILVRPLIAWIWIGGVVITLGIIVTVLPFGGTRKSDG